MKLIIAGSRTMHESELVLHDLSRCLLPFRLDDITEIVCGMAQGADMIGLNYSRINNVKLARFPADWDTHGKAAGFIRNRKMAEYSDALLLIWDGESRGSSIMKKEMQKLGKPIYEIIIRTENV